MSTTHYDALIIGSGQAAGPLATALVGAGRKTAVIEWKHVGGTCINEGCTPSKTMVASARVAYLARRSEEYGVHSGTVGVDLARVRRRKQEIVERFRGGSQQRIERGGVDLLMGTAAFTGPTSLEVRLNDGGSLALAADAIFVNAGARPTVPKLPGLESVPFLDSTTIMELDHLPEHLLILGGGYVGLEFAQMFRRFGSRVTVIQRGPRLLAREDADICGAVADIMREDGVDVRLESEAIQVEREGDGVCLIVRTPDGERHWTGSHLLVAVGRTPNSDRLDLAAAGVEVDERGHILVNERLETNVPGV